MYHIASRNPTLEVGIIGAAAMLEGPHKVCTFTCACAYIQETERGNHMGLRFGLLIVVELFRLNSLSSWRTELLDLLN